MENIAYAISPADPAATGWPVAGQLIDALNRRNFVDLIACFDPEVNLRAVLPRAVLELHSAETVGAKFEQWFGGADGFEVVDASAGEIGPRQYLRWRVRMWSVGRSDKARVVEQHAFARGTDRIKSLDLLCSGFQDELTGGAR